MAKFIFNPLAGQLTPVLNTAAEIEFDPTASSLNSDEVQAALDEVAGRLDAVETLAGDAIPDSEKGANNGVATLDAGGKIPVSQLPNSVMEYLGTWAASTNTPTLADSVGNAGDVYIASDAGTVNFGAGPITFAAGDWVVYSGSVWQKSSNSNAVVSVNGQTGIVSLDTDDISEGTNLYFTDERAQDAVGGIVATSAKVSLTYTDATPEIIADIVTGSLVNTDISASAAIDRTKIANGTANRVVVNNGSGVLSDAAAITASRALESDANGIPIASATTATELSYVSGVTSAIQTQLNGKEPTITQLPIAQGGTNSVAALNNNRVMQSSGGAIVEAAAITASRALESDANGIPVASSVTATELGYVSGTRSTIQTQIDVQAANNARNLNWILNYGVEVNADGYAAYADAAQSTPVDGTGGSPNVTITRSTSSPLDGVASLEFVKDAADRQGQGFSYDFTIDSAHQGTIQQITFNYKVLSGTYTSGDLTVWIYDVTNGVLLPQPSGNSIISTGVPSQQGQCTSQTAINSTSYRLIVHVSTTSASAYTLQFDNICVGPQVNASGSVDTSWAAYTPAISQFGTVSNVDFKWRREGPDLLVIGRFTSGTVATGEPRIPLPSGLVSADNSVLPATLSLAGSVAVSGNSTTFFQEQVLIEPSQSYVVFGKQSSTTGATTKTTNASNDFVSSGLIYVTFRVPIAGWSSNTVVSTSGNTKPVVFTGTNASQAVTANVTNFTLTATKDSVAGWSTNIYTVQVPGDYDVSLTASSSSASTISVYRNGSAFQSLDSVNNTAGGGSIIMPNLVVGDTISFRSSTSVTILTMYGSIALRQSPQQIAASEVIAGVARGATTTVGTSATDIINPTKEFDTHNCYNTTTGWWTAPAPGIYEFNHMVGAASGIATTFASASTITMSTVITSSIGSPADIDVRFGLGTNATQVNLAAMSYSRMLNLAAGDTIKFTIFRSSDVSSYSLRASSSVLSWKRLGGV